MNKCGDGVERAQESFQTQGGGELPHSPLQNFKALYRVAQIEKKESHPWLLHKHYAKCIPNIMHAFGLFSENVLVGVLCYGTPANNHNNNLGSFKMIELVRLVLNEGLPKNTASFFITKTFKLLPTPLALISYADQGKNHAGYVYQATNWLYTGLGGGVDFYRDEHGKEIHSRIMSDYRLKYPNKTRAEIAVMLKWESVKGTFKHRYFYLLGTSEEKATMKSILIEKYPLQPYPKSENKRYDSTYQPETQITLF